MRPKRAKAFWLGAAVDSVLSRTRGHEKVEKPVTSSQLENLMYLLFDY